MLRRASGSSIGDLPLVQTPNGCPARLEDPEAKRGLATLEPISNETDPGTNAASRPQSTRGRRSDDFSLRASGLGNGRLGQSSITPDDSPTVAAVLNTRLSGPCEFPEDMDKSTLESPLVGRRPRSRSPWAVTVVTLAVSLAGIALLATIFHSLVTRQREPKGCRMSYMRPSYARLQDFDTEHTRFASKYSLYLYREQGIDDDTKVRWAVLPRGEWAADPRRGRR